LVDLFGTRRTATMLGVAPWTIVSVLAGTPVMRRTVAKIEAALPSAEGVRR
jgi:hypothetical protein